MTGNVRERLAANATDTHTVTQVSTENGGRAFGRTAILNVPWQAQVSEPPTQLSLASGMPCGAVSTISCPWPHASSSGTVVIHFDALWPWGTRPGGIFAGGQLCGCGAARRSGAASDEGATGEGGGGGSSLRPRPACSRSAGRTWLGGGRCGAASPASCTSGCGSSTCCSGTCFSG